MKCCFNVKLKDTETSLERPGQIADVNWEGNVNMKTFRNVENKCSI